MGLPKSVVAESELGAGPVGPVSLWPALFAAALGVGVGLAGNLVDADGISFAPGAIATALVLSPLAAMVGSQNVSFPFLHLPLAIGGLLFVPVEVLLLVWWKRSGRRAILFLTVLWTAQAYFQILHRLEVLLSV